MLRSFEEGPVPSYLNVDSKQHYVLRYQRNPYRKSVVISFKPLENNTDLVYIHNDTYKNLVKVIKNQSVIDTNSTIDFKKNSTVYTFPNSKIDRDVLNDLLDKYDSVNTRKPETADVFIVSSKKFPLFERIEEISKLIDEETQYLTENPCRVIPMDVFLRNYESIKSVAIRCMKEYNKRINTSNSVWYRYKTSSSYVFDSASFFDDRPGSVILTPYVLDDLAKEPEFKDLHKLLMDLSIVYEVPEDYSLVTLNNGLYFTDLSINIRSKYTRTNTSYSINTDDNNYKELQRLFSELLSLKPECKIITPVVLSNLLADETDRVMDEDIYENIFNLLASNDVENHILGAKLLTTYPVNENNFIYQWMLFTGFKHSSLQTKENSVLRTAAGKRIKKEVGYASIERDGFSKKPINDHIQYFLRAHQYRFKDTQPNMSLFVKLYVEFLVKYLIKFSTLSYDKNLDSLTKRELAKLTIVYD